MCVYLTGRINFVLVSCKLMHVMLRHTVETLNKMTGIWELGEVAMLPSHASHTPCLAQWGGSWMAL